MNETQDMKLRALIEALNRQMVLGQKTVPTKTMVRVLTEVLGAGDES